MKMGLQQDFDGRIGLGGQRRDPLPELSTQEGHYANSLNAKRRTF